MFLVFCIRGFFFPIIFCCFFFVRKLFSVKFILHSLWYMPLVYVFVNLFFFNVVFCVCSSFIFFLLTRCQYYMNYWTHTPFNCWQNRPDYWVCSNGKKIYIINYIGLHSFVKCDRKNLFNRKKYFWWSVTRTLPPPFLTSKLQEWLTMKFLLENCLLDLIVVLDLDLGSILIDNVYFFTIATYSLVGSILSTIERCMCPVIHVILTSG